MPTLARVLYQDPFMPVLLSVDSEALVVSPEQRLYIREILEIGASDTAFAQKMYDAISFVLTSGPVVPPVVTSLNPSTVVIGSPSFDIHVVGTGFTPTSKIIFNGFEEPTTFVSETELTTGVNMDLWAAAVEVPVAVQAANGVMSDPMDFTFTDTVARIAEKAEEKKREDARLKMQLDRVAEVKKQMEADAKKQEEKKLKDEKEAGPKDVIPSVPKDKDFTAKEEPHRLHDMKDVKEDKKDSKR